MTDDVDTGRVAIHDETPRLLVLGGIARGGTTLMREVVGSHPDVALFSRELRALCWSEFPCGLHVAAVHWYLWRARRRFGSRAFRRQAYGYMWHLLRQNGIYDRVRVSTARLAFAQCLASPSTKYVGDKYPGYVSCYPKFIHEEGCRCIFIVRDPRDSISSLHEKIRSGVWNRRWTRRVASIAGATERWVEAARTIDDVRALGGNALVIRYEDLVLESRRTLEGVAGHLDLSAGGFDPGIPHTSSIGRHKQFLTPP